MSQRTGDQTLTIHNFIEPVDTYIDGLAQDCSKSIANALQLL